MVQILNYEQLSKIIHMTKHLQDRVLSVLMHEPLIAMWAL